MKIAVDIDDTLNIVERVERGSAYIARKGLPFKLVKPDSNKFVDVFDWKIEDVLRFIREEGGITSFTAARVRKGARKALSGWRAAGHEIVILTARTREWFGDPARVSREWLKKHRIPYDQIVAEVRFAEKGKYCAEHGISILIDDNPEACLDAQAHGVSAVLAIREHNAARAQEIAYGGANWQEIDMAVRSILETL